MSARASLSARVVARVGALAIEAAIDTEGGTLVVVGPNGAGKSTLLSLLLGVRSVERGRVQVGEVVLCDTESGVDVPIEHRRLGYVPQDYGLFPHLTVRGNLAFAVASARSNDGARRVDAALAELGLEALADRYPRSLSGGEKQRVALARALSVRPRALLLDEPLAALDAPSRRDVRGLLAETLRRQGLPTIVVTHDAADAVALADRIAVLEAGRISQQGTWQELSARPATPFVEVFVAS